MKCEDVNKMINQKIASIDKDDNGKISKKEFIEHVKAESKGKKVKRAEIKKLYGHVMRNCDSDSDGKLTGEELRCCLEGYVNHLRHKACGDKAKEVVCGNCKKEEKK